MHRQDDPLQLEARIEVVADEIDRRHQLAQPLQGVVLALEWDDDAVGSGQRVHREQAERWWTVQQHVVVGTGRHLEGTP